MLLPKNSVPFEGLYSSSIRSPINELFEKFSILLQEDKSTLKSKICSSSLSSSTNFIVCTQIKKLLFFSYK